MEKWKKPTDEDIEKRFKQNNDFNREIQSSSSYSLYSNMYFVFIDALGFKSYFDKKENSIKEDENINNKFIRVFNEYFQTISELEDKVSNADQCKSYFGQTSDSLYFYTSRADHLIEFIKVYSFFNIKAMAEDVFFRGGIAKGNLFINKNYQFFGDSVIKAFLLESSIAKNPVILIDSSTYKDICNYDKNQNIANIITHDKERYILDPFAYFTKSLLFQNKNETLIIELKEKIKNNIRKNKFDYEYDEKLYSKFINLESRFKQIDE